jgi:hypothetical protein
MADTIGVLGSASATTVATTTVYTCPSGKAAKVRLMARFQGDTNTVVAILVNGMEVARNAVMTTAHYNYTIKGGGIYAYAAGNAAAPSGLADALTVAPADPIYYLSEGDTIQYTIVTAACLAMNFQVVGVEIDL